MKSELEAEYSNYLQSLGAPTKLVRKYAYGNAVLPQMSGLALALGAVVGGALVTEIVFGYPGIGTLIITALQNRDYFLMQGLFLLIITVGIASRKGHSAILFGIFSIFCPIVALIVALAVRPRV